MAASAAAYIARGCPSRAALVLEELIEGVSTDQHSKLLTCGFSYPLATELIRQMVAGTGTESNLAALGMPHMLAALVATDITATDSE